MLFYKEKSQYQILSLGIMQIFHSFVSQSIYILINYCPSSHLRILMSMIPFLTSVLFIFFLIWESPCQWSIFTCPSFLFSGLRIILSMTFPLMSVQFVIIPHLHPAPLPLGNPPGRAEGQLAGLYASLYKKKTQSFFHFEQFSFLPYVPMST